jgi:hypothetical protein
MNSNANPEGQRDNGQGHEHQPFAAPNNMDLGSMLNDEAATHAPTHFDGSPATDQAAVRRAEHEANGVAAVERGNHAVDEYAQQQLERKFGLLEKVLTDRSMYQQVQKVRREMLQVSSQYRLNFYKTIMDARLEALRERCESGLKIIKAAYRQQVASFLMAQMQKLSMEVRDRQMTFINMMKEKYAFAETLNGHPSMKLKYMESVHNEEGRYLRFLDDLVLRFESIVTEQLERHH